MKIAITSDVHNNEVNLGKVLAYCKEKKIETLVCCGDLASIDTLNFLNDNFSGNILYTFGNADYDDLRELETQKKYKRIYLFKRFGEAIIEKKNVAFTHYPQKAKNLALTRKYAFVFYGHTHKPWTEKINNCTMLNPGNVAGEIYPPTFAVWNTENDTFELIRIHSLK